MDEQIVQSVRRERIEVARARETVTYKVLASRAGLDVSTKRGWQSPLFRALNVVCADGPYLLSAVVVGKKTDRPGEGFFTMAKQLRGVRPRSDAARERFWTAELARVYDHPR